jgi:tetratricopeptide (TPR) repeat protein
MRWMVLSGIMGLSGLLSLSWGFLGNCNPSIAEENSKIASPQGVRSTPQPQNTIAAKVDQIAQQITVRIDSKLSGTGSGVIVARQGNTYTVLTAEHVVPKPDQYTVITPDGQSHAVRMETVKQFEGVDLAVLKFSSPQTYSVATLANYTIDLGDRPLVFLSGFPGGKGIPHPTRKLTAGTASPTGITLFTTQSAYSVSSGRELTYTSFSQPGMSGGPVLDQIGRVIGIHNASETRLEEDESGEVFAAYLGRSLGVPISTFLGLAPRAGVEPTLLKIEQHLPPSIGNPEVQAAISSLMTAQPPGKDANAFDWLRYGNQLWRIQRYPEAVSALDRAIQLKSNFYQAHYVKGVALSAQNQMEGAIVAFDTALKIQPQFYEALRRKADALYELKQFGAAQSALERAIQIKPDDYALHTLLGNVLIALKQPTAAQNAYTKSITLKANYYTYFQRGLARFNAGDYQNALADYTKAIELQPNDIYSYISRGNLHFALGNNTAALADLNQARSNLLSNSPFQPILALSLGLVELGMGNRENAIKTWTTGLDSLKGRKASADITTSLYQGRALAYAQTNNLPAAIADMNQLIQLQPKRASAYYNRGSFYMQSQDPQRAVLDFTQAIALQSDYAEAYQSRGLAYQALRDQEKAIPDFQRAIALLTGAINKSPNSLNIANSYVQRAVALLGTGDQPGALKDIQAAKSLFEQNGIRSGALYQSIQKMQTLLQGGQKQRQAPPAPAPAFPQSPKGTESMW